ncbi:hypothetical protein RND71_043737 [Anisodus tanguticus]|uniref:Matrin-type domain-containing protein n=1 Tax=Anisodus tanguticus TaxID=243964 RepID=A0AAE1UTA2_9SOLA|nr:hypothetical protein RND71_043737 [Anisodus tanguticus]
MSTEFDEFKKLKEIIDLNLVDFTDEEGYGKYFDLNECFNKFVNLKNIEKIDYLTYLNKFDNFVDIPKERKLNSEYKEYVNSLLNYLYDFCVKVKPLIDIERLFNEELKEDFEKRWENSTFPGWPKETSSVLKQTGARLDLSTFSSWEELASLGLDRLKLALIAVNLKCGGTLEERAKRLFLIKDKNLDEINPNLFVKNKNEKSGQFKSNEKQKEIAYLEAQIMKLGEILSEQKIATIENVQRKQARTAGEREESDEEISQNESDDEEDDEVIYNPKNLPLGWDGKPIPYWLYKLHGLNITYTCEICGNAIYKGPKAFQIHFAEWRHAHGMRCLGIPNTAHFANVTSIEDALNLWNKLKDEKQKEKFQPTNEEEYEDSEGRVDFKPWLLEVNISPSLRSESSVDTSVKGFNKV